MKETIKILKIYLSRFLLSFFHIFPINKKRILFIAFSGKNYTCNPKYIYQEILKHNFDYEYIWVLNNKNEKPENCKIVPYLSLRFYYYFFTSKMIVTNYSISSKLPVRKKQILFNTWHGGGAYKKVGVTKISKEQRRIRKVFEILNKETSYFLSSCKIDTETILDTFHYPNEKMLNIGYPRNDLFFDKTIDIQKEKKRICNQLSINPDKKILLLAPTYRGEAGFGISKDKCSLNVKKVCKALSKKFGNDFVCIYRGHYYVNTNALDNCINGSNYPDMQELLLISDVLITDYSSSIWDFSFTKKPCFLFTPDLLEYSETQEFYVPIDKWGFDYAITEDELINKIMNFDQIKYESDLKVMHDYYGAFDKGDSAKQVVEFIRKIMN